MWNHHLGFLLSPFRWWFYGGIDFNMMVESLQLHFRIHFVRFDGLMIYLIIFCHGSKKNGRLAKKHRAPKKNKQIPAFGRLLNAIHQPTTNCMILWSCQSPCVFSDLTASAVLFARKSDHPKCPNEKWEDISTRTQGLLVYIRAGPLKTTCAPNPKHATSYSIGRPGTLPPRNPKTCLCL